MNERAFKTVGRSGAWNLVLGIVVIVIGVGTGVMLLINGAKLLSAKSSILI